MCESLFSFLHTSCPSITYSRQFLPFHHGTHHRQLNNNSFVLPFLPPHLVIWINSLLYNSSMHSNYNLKKNYYYKNNEYVMSAKKNVIQKMNIVKYHSHITKITPKTADQPP